MDSYRYSGIYLNDRRDWRTKSNAVNRKGMSRLYFVRKLIRSEIFYQPVVLIEDLHHHHERYCYCLLLSTTNNPSHPLQSTLLKQGSSSSLKLIQPHVHKECLRKSFLLFSWVYTVHTIFFNDICTTLHLY